MNKNFGLVLAIIFSIGNSFAEDRGFRFEDGKCINDQGEQGYNPYFQGQCSDWRDADLRRFNLQNRDLKGSTFEGVDLTEANLSGADLQSVIFKDAKLIRAKLARVVLFETQFTNADLTEVNLQKADISGVKFESATFARADFQDSVIFESSFSKINLTESKFRNVRFEKVEFKDSNLMGSDLVSTTFLNSTITEANLSKVQLDRAKFTGGMINKVDLKNATARRLNLDGTQLENLDFTGTDLRSAVLNYKVGDRQTSVFKNARINKRSTFPWDQKISIQMGMILAKGGLLVIWDAKNAVMNSFIENLKKEDVEFEMTGKAYHQLMAEDIDLADFGSAVIFVSAGSNYQEINEGVQKELLEFVNDGGTFITTEWIGYMYENRNFVKTMSDLILFRYGNAGPYIANRVASFTVENDYKDHPLFEDVPMKFTTDRAVRATGAPLRTFSDNPSKTLMKGDNNTPALAVREVGEGRVIAFSHTGSHTGTDSTNEKHFFKILLNAVEW